MKLSIATRTDRLISKPIGDGISESNVASWISEIRSRLSMQCSDAALFWPPQPERDRLYAYLFDGSSCVGFAKISTKVSGDEALRREAETLRELESAPLTKCRVPRLLGQGYIEACSRSRSDEETSGRRTFIVLEPLPTTARPVSRTQSLTAMQEILEYAGSTRRISREGLEALEWWKRYTSALDSLCEPFHSQLSDLLANGFESCRAHGDLSVHNLVFDRKRIWVLDWEQSCSDAPRLTDPVGLAMSWIYRKTLRKPEIVIDLLKTQFLRKPSSTQRLNLMMAIAFRHAAHHKDATAVMKNWQHLV